jgi:hypothetical protein
MRALALVLLVSTLASACGGGGGVLKREYEYEEELYLSLDGTATLNVNASVASLVALRGADLDVSPRARLDRERVRALFRGPGVEVSRVSLSRRDGRRFVHVSLDVDDVRRLNRVALFSWSDYRLARNGDVVEFKQLVGPAAGKSVGDVGWTGSEIVAFRLHIPSVIPYHNAPSRETQRGNIVEWDQPLAARLKGEPLDIEVHMEPESILYSTLILFGSTIVAAALAFAIVIWWVMRRGRDLPAEAGSHPVAGSHP